MANNEGLKVDEKKLKLNDVYDADEAFFTGTAAEITAIASVDDKKIGKDAPGPVTKKLQELFHAITRGKNGKYEDWLAYVNE